MARSSLRRPEVIWVGALSIAVITTIVAASRVPTTLGDFFGPGTQPGGLIHAIEHSTRCDSCHGGYDDLHEPYTPWAASMMAQSARDPMLWAALAIAEQDAAFAGDMCLRCHAPGGWLAGRSTPTDGSALIADDFDGVNCNMCHRMVDPDYKPGVSPLVDAGILGDLAHPPMSEHSGHFVIDPLDRRRGPYDLGGFSRHEWLESPYHMTSNNCASCHDVSNPAYERQPDGTYVLGPLDQPHPTHDKYDQFPLERTYSEWSASDFAKGPIDMGGRFGGIKLAVSSCQDCHMPDVVGKGAKQGEIRSDLGTHLFNGGSTWMLQAVRNLYPDSETGLTDSSVAQSIARAEDMLAKASDMELTIEGGQLNVRIINQTGHKLPTGYPEGRRMWINVRFLDADGALVAERGAYDATTAELAADDTKVYEGKLGVDEAVSAATGVPVGPSFHFAINNVWYKDNRIPPRGFTNSGFEAVQAAPVGYAYDDGQYWDDTRYALPPRAVRAEVSLHYQTASKEYIEFLRDENRTNDAGLTMYLQWEILGKSPPVLMDREVIDLPASCPADLDGDGVLTLFDFLEFQNLFDAGDPRADFDGDGSLTIFDFLAFQNAFDAGC